MNGWLGLLLSEPIPSAREMEDPGKKATTKKSNVISGSHGHGKKKKP